MAGIVKARVSDDAQPPQNARSGQHQDQPGVQNILERGGALG
jgi:hypothetical protein